MPKMKNNSGASKRFKIFAGGKVRSASTGKRHGMIKRSSRSLRNNRGTKVLCKTSANIVKKYLPNNI